MIKQNRTSKLKVTEYYGALSEAFTQMRQENFGSALFYFNLHMSTHEPCATTNALKAELMEKVAHAPRSELTRL